MLSLFYRHQKLALLPSISIVLEQENPQMQQNNNDINTDKNDNDHCKNFISAHLSGVSSSEILLPTRSV